MAIPLQLTANATGTTLVLTIASDPSYVPDASHGGGVSNFDITFQYTAAGATFASGTAGTGYTVVPNGSTAGTVVLGGFASDGGVGQVPGSVLARLTFNLSGATPQDFPVTFSATSLNDDAPAAGMADPTVACFVRGTLIRTERGEVPVEELELGDLVSTTDGDASPVIWVGRRRIACGAHPAPHDVWPVRIHAGAIAPGVPARDLILSPDHSLELGGILIPVRYLLNGATIVQEQWSEVTYFHVELERHAILFAEDARAESYLETGVRSEFAVSTTVVTLPAKTLAVWAAKACRPLVFEGKALEAARSALMTRAVATGHLTTSDPALHLLVDGTPVPPSKSTRSKAGNHHTFTVDPAAKSVVLVSRSFVPAHMLPTMSDHRTLGVAVRKVAMDGRDYQPRGNGWHDAEDGLQWTSGHAELPAGASCIEVSTSALGLYWSADSPSAPARACAA